MAGQKVALITGANRGLGFEIARQLAEQGLHVLLAARNRTAGTQAAQQLERVGANVDFVELEVSSPQRIATAGRIVSQLVDHLDVLINNAAVLGDEQRSILETGTAQLQQILATNALAALWTTTTFLPLLARSTAPRIINVSSGSGVIHHMDGYAPAYSISKATLNALTRQLAVALRHQGVAVNAVCPGWVRTDMGGTAAPRSVRAGADTVVWLATAAPQRLTGAFFRDRKVIPW